MCRSGDVTSHPVPPEDGWGITSPAMEDDWKTGKGEVIRIDKVFTSLEGTFVCGPLKFSAQGVGLKWGGGRGWGGEDWIRDLILGRRCTQH